MRHHQSPSKTDTARSPQGSTACFTVGSGSPWNQGSAAPPETMPAVIVLDDCDPNFRGDARTHDDGLRLLDAEGKEIRRVGGLSDCENIAMNHGIATDPERGGLSRTGRTPGHGHRSCRRILSPPLPPPLPPGTGEARLDQEHPRLRVAAPASESAQRVRSARASSARTGIRLASPASPGPARHGLSTGESPGTRPSRRAAPRALTNPGPGRRHRQQGRADLERDADQVLRLRYGVAVVKSSLGKPSGQVWLTAF